MSISTLLIRGLSLVVSGNLVHPQNLTALSWSVSLAQRLFSAAKTFFVRRVNYRNGYRDSEVITQ